MTVRSVTILSTLESDLLVSQHSWTLAQYEVMIDAGPEYIKLIVEVTASTLDRDRGAKNKLYASFGLPEYWILNLIDKQVELYTEPTETEGYGKREDFAVGEMFSSLLLGELSVSEVMAMGVRRSNSIDQKDFKVLRRLIGVLSNTEKVKWDSSFKCVWV